MTDDSLENIQAANSINFWTFPTEDLRHNYLLNRIFPYIYPIEDKKPKLSIYSLYKGRYQESFSILSQYEQS